MFETEDVDIDGLLVQDEWRTVLRKFNRQSLK